MRAMMKAGILVPLVLLAVIFKSPEAAASMIDGTAVDIATEAGGHHLWITGQPSAFVLEDFISSMRGTVTLVTKTFDSWDPVSTMTTRIFPAGAPTLVLNGAGALVFNVDAGQVFSTNLSFTTAGPRGYGMAGYDISFVPRAAPVPLPAGLWLLASGAALLAGAAKRRVET